MGHENTLSCNWWISSIEGCIHMYNTTMIEYRLIGVYMKLHESCMRPCMQAHACVHVLYILYIIGGHNILEEGVYMYQCLMISVWVSTCISASVCG